MATRSEKVQIVVGAKDKASSTLSKVKNQIIGIGAAYLGFRAITGILSSITKAGMEHEKVWTEVAGALKRQGHEIDNNIKSIKKFSDEMQTLTGISDEVFGKGIQLFVDYGATIDEAKDTMKVAADLAAGSGMEMSAAVDLLAKAQVGYTGTLSRYGIILDESIPKNEKFAAAVAQINEKFGGAAADRMDTTAVKVSLLSQKFGDLQEELFKVGAPALLAGVETMTNVVSSLIGLFSDTAAIDRITDLRVEMESVGSKTEGLVATYTRLVTETNLTTTEQDALKTVTQQLAELVPTAVTAWDEYGNVIGINTDKINAYVEAQEDALKVEFLRTVGDLRAEFENLLRAQNVVRGSLVAWAKVDDAYAEQRDEALRSGNELLRQHSAKIERMLAVGSTAYPELVAGTTAYKEAVQLLGQEFANQIIAFQENAQEQIAIAANTSKAIVAITSDTTTSLIGIHDELQEQYDEDAQYLVDLQHETNKEILEDAITRMDEELAAFEEMEKAKIETANQWARSMSAILQRYSREFTKTLWGTSQEARGIFKKMAIDFANLFVEATLRQLADDWAVGVIKILGLFHIPKYDTFAMQQGKHFAQHFTRGALGEMAGFPGQFAPAITSPISPMLNAVSGPAAGTVIINFNGPVTSADFVRNEIIPAIEDMSQNRFTNIVYDESTITGDPAVEFA